MSLPIVTIIIPTYDDWDRLSLCLEALSQQTFAKDKFEIIVVNNNPGDKEPQNYWKPENCIIIEESAPGSYAARNAALKLSKGEIIGFTDSDCIPNNDWIENAVTFFTHNQKIKRIGGAIQIFFKQTPPSKVELYDMIFAFPQEAYVKAGNAVTANMFTYKHSSDEVGFFDESLMSGGDYKWGKQAQQQGLPIKFAANVIVKHPARPSLKDLVIKARRIGKGQANFSGNKVKGNYKTLVEVIKLLQPRTWEIKKIFKEAKSYSFGDKLFLVILRHYILWVGDYSRIENRRNKIAIR